MSTIRNLRYRTLVALVFLAVGSVVILGAVLVVGSDESEDECQAVFDGELENRVVFDEEPENRVVIDEEPERRVVVIDEDPERRVAFDEELERRARFVGEARRSGSSTIVAYVNGLPVTAADIAEGRAQVAVNLEGMRDQISRIVPDDQAHISPGGTPLPPGVVRVIPDYQDKPIPESYGLRELLEVRIAIIEQHGVDTAVLAGAVRDRALCTAATAAGHSADPAEIAARVAEIKFYWAEGQFPELQGYVSAVGEEVFFTELLPNGSARDLAIASWRRELSADATSNDAARRIWHDAEQRAVLGARVTLTNEPGLDATIEGLSAYQNDYRAISVPPTTPQPPPPCGSAVPNQGDNSKLLRDCRTLLAAKDALRGTATLNWSASTDMGNWTGVTTEGTPGRVTKVELPDKSLTGSIPAVLGRLFALTHLDLSGNSLTGNIPPELRWLHNLESLKLSGNNLTGCIPLALRDVPTNDLSSLNLPYCQPPAPGAPTAGTATETSVPLTWTAAANASKYRVDYREVPSGFWATDEDDITTTSHTVYELGCATAYQFRLSVYGDGTVYGAAWSEPSAAVDVTTTACE